MGLAKPVVAKPILFQVTRASGVHFHPLMTSQSEACVPNGRARGRPIWLVSIIGTSERNNWSCYGARSWSRSEWSRPRSDSELIDSEQHGPAHGPTVSGVTSDEPAGRACLSSPTTTSGVLFSH